MKTCRTCQVEKPLTDFYVKANFRRMKSGELRTYQSVGCDCKKCANRISANYGKMKVFKKVHKEYERQKTLESIQ